MLKYQQAYEHILGCSLSPDAKGQVKVKCPFHDDKNPSMSINLETGLFNCFGCGAKGNAKQFAERLGYKLINRSSIPDVVLDAGQKQYKPKAKAKTKPKIKPKAKAKAKAKVVYKESQPFSIDSYAEEKQLDKDFLIKTCKVWEQRGVVHIPYFDVNGEEVYNKARGSSKKFYYASKGKEQGVIPYGLWRLKDVKKDEDIFIVEGESDTQTLWMNGYQAIGFPGVDTVSTAGMPYLEYFRSIHFRNLYIVSESDQGGEKFVSNLYKLLGTYAPDLFVKAYVIFPADMIISQKDTNDIWCLNPNHDFFKSKVDSLIALGMKLNVAYKSLSNKKSNARELRHDALCSFLGLKAFYDDKGQFWVWKRDTNQYININDDKYLKDHLLQEGYIKTQKINEILGMLKSFILNEKDKPEDLSDKYIYCANGEFNYETMNLEHHDNSYFIHNRIPFNYNPNAKSPIVDKIFSDWVDDPTYLYELIGYSMLRSYPGNRITFLFGLGNNGKSTFANVLRELLTGRKLGEFYADNASSISLTQLLEDQFAGADLFQKYVNIAGETPFSCITNTAVLKQATGEDFIRAQKKYQDGFEFFTHAKLIFATNRIPQSLDRTPGWYRRIVIIEFKTIPKSKVDTSLLSKLGKEDYEYILFKSIQALHNLANNGFKFTIENTIDMEQKYKDLSDIVKYFVKVNCEITKDENDYIATATFADEFTKWVKNSKMPLISNKEIYKEMRELGFESKRRRIIGGDRIYCFTGIRFKTESKNMDEDVLNYADEF